MKYIKSFEKFDLGRFSDTEEDGNDRLINNINDIDDIEEEDENEEEDFYFSDDEDNIDIEEDERVRVWGDDIVESKKTK